MSVDGKKLGTSLPEEFTWPDYEGGSISNMPATVAALLHANFAGLPPLRKELWQSLASGVKRVIVLIIDAWGWNLLEQEQARLNGFLKRAAVVGKLTSVFPSTTVAALSTLWTGVAPASHGLVGLRLFLPEYAALTQMLKFTPTFGSYPDALIKAGMDPTEFLHFPGFAEQLAASGISTHVFKGRDIVDSALSKMHGRGVAGDHGISSAADMFTQMRLLLEEQAGERLYISAYWPLVDTLSHIYGWDQPSVAAELRATLALLQSELLDPLSAAARSDTALFIMADHGQVLCPPEQQIYLEDHPELKRLLLMRPAGEPRTAYLYGRQGCREEIVAYINQHLGEAMVAIMAEKALAAGLLGPEPHAPVADERVGDVIVTMREGYILLTPAEKERAHKMKGRHGGMTHDEMWVPWLGYRLDAW